MLVIRLAACNPIKEICSAAHAVGDVVLARDHATIESCVHFLLISALPEPVNGSMGRRLSDRSQYASECEGFGCRLSDGQCTKDVYPHWHGLSLRKAW